MKVKTSELSGAALDWAVAECEGVSVRWSAAHEQILIEGYPYIVWQPLKDWAQGGPIIEREGIAIGKSWESWKAFTDTSTSEGPTPLIAAMRCYIASKLGDTVEIPEGLQNA